MHQTTVRFTSDLWSQLEQEARNSGVSAAQYVRDATLARMAYTAGQRGEPMYGEAAEPDEPLAVAPDPIGDAARESLETGEGSDAVWAQARQARRRARVVREDARAAQAQIIEARLSRAAGDGPESSAIGG
jgi:hypothetical protein